MYVPINHHLVNSLPVLRVALSSHLGVERLQGNSGNVHATPHGHYEKQTSNRNQLVGGEYENCINRE